MSHLVIFMIVIYQISLDFYSPKTKDFFSETRSVTCFILHLKTEWFQTLIFSKYDTVENKRINIGIFDISNVTFGNFYDCALSNMFATSVSKMADCRNSEISLFGYNIFKIWYSRK